MKKIFYYLQFSIILLIILAPNVYAASASDENRSSAPSCAHKWCYNNAALRVSLYKYKSGSLTYYGSKDYDTYYSEIKGWSDLKNESARISIKSSSNTSAIGKVAYTNLSGYNVNWTSTYYTNLVISKYNGSDKFYSYLDCNATNSKCINNTSRTITKQIEKWVGINNPASINSSMVVTKINSIFGYSFNVSDAPYLYITFEPLYYIFNNSHSYFGSIYELLNLNTGSENSYKGDSFLGIDGQLYRDFMLNILASNPTNTDTNNFVSDKSNAKVILADEDDLDSYSSVLGSSSSRQKNRKKFGGTTSGYSNTNTGFGIGVVWIGDYIRDCKSICASGGLKCAENYCDKVNNPDINSDADKSECVFKCGYKRPDGASCDKECSADPNSTCAAEGTYTNKTCRPGPNGYYSIQCEEKVTLNYSNGLPKILGPKIGGINYSLKVNTKKTCDVKYALKRVEYDYAVLLRSSTTKRQQIKDKLNPIIRDNVDIDSDPEFTFESVDSNQIKLKINDSEVSDSEFIKIKSTEKDNSVSTYTTTLHFYGDGNQTYEDENQTYKFVSNTTVKDKLGKFELYQLHNKCLSLKDSFLKKECDTNPNYELKPYQQYYGYYNSIKKNGTVDVGLSVSKSYLDGTSCGVEDKCHYYVDDKPNDTDCYIKNNKLYITNLGDPYNLSDEHGMIRYCFRPNDTSIPTAQSDLVDFCNDLTGDDYSSASNRNVPSNNMAIVKYHASYDGKIIAKSCPTVPNSSGGTCKTLYKASEHDAIRTYCNSKFSNDGYATPDECYNDCANEDGKSCKSNVICSNYESVYQWCNNSINRNTAGYKSKEQCIADCNCTKNDVKYIYRSVALGSITDPSNTENTFKAFPGRSAGSNWKGLEYLTTDAWGQTHGKKLYGQKPVYVIKFNSKSVKKVNEDTTDKYVYKDFSNFEKYPSGTANGINLKSLYINDNENREIFTCINGVGADCKNYFKDSYCSDPSRASWEGCN